MEHLVVTKRTVDFQNNIRTLSILRNLDSGHVKHVLLLLLLLLLFIVEYRTSMIKAAL